MACPAGGTVSAILAPMTEGERERFDGLLEEAIEGLPDRIHALLEEVPLIVDDRPEEELVRRLALELGEDVSAPGAAEAFASELCGLHSGAMLTERSVEDAGDVPEDIRLFREGILNLAGGWAAGDDAVFQEIAITLLHEIGHHFGLEEEDLEELGYE